MSSRVLIVPTGAVPDGALETLLRALARAAKGCRFSIATEDASDLLARFGDRFQIWPVRARLVPLVRRLREVDLLLVLGTQRGDTRTLGRLVLLSSLARRDRRPVVAIDWPTEPGRGLAGSLAKRIERACGLVHPRGASPPSVADSVAERLVRPARPGQAIEAINATTP